MEAGNRAYLSFLLLCLLLVVFPLYPVCAEKNYSSDKYMNSPLGKLSDQTDTTASGKIQQKIQNQSGDFYGDGFFWFLLKIAGGLAIASFCIWGIAKLVRKTGLAGTNNDFMQIHSTLPLSRDQYLRIVQIGKKFMVLGITSESINKICEITEPDVIQELQLASEEKKENEQSRDFSSILNRFLGGSHSFKSKQNPDSFENLKDKLQNLQQGAGE